MIVGPSIAATFGPATASFFATIFLVMLGRTHGGVLVHSTHTHTCTRPLFLSVKSQGSKRARKAGGGPHQRQRTARLSKESA